MSTNPDSVKKVLAQQIKASQDDTRKTLDALRKTRKARGGTGAPLDVPRHLHNPIFVTDAELADGLSRNSPGSKLR